MENIIASGLASGCKDEEWQKLNFKNVMYSNKKKDF